MSGAYLCSAGPETLFRLKPKIFINLNFIFFFFSFKNKKFDPLLIFHFFLIFIWILGTYIECVHLQLLQLKPQ